MIPSWIHHTNPVLDEQAIARLRDDSRRSIVFVAGQNAVRFAQSLRDNDGNGYKTVLRAPHWSCSERTLVEELALAAGGVMVFEDVVKFNLDALEAMARIWARMERPSRPTIVCQVELCLGNSQAEIDLSWARHLAIAGALTPWRSEEDQQNYPTPIYNLGNRRKRQNAKLIIELLDAEAEARSKP